MAGAGAQVVLPVAGVQASSVSGGMPGTVLLPPAGGLRLLNLQHVRPGGAAAGGDAQSIAAGLSRHMNTAAVHSLMPHFLRLVSKNLDPTLAHITPEHIQRSLESLTTLRNSAAGMAPAHAAPPSCGPPATTQPPTPPAPTALAPRQLPPGLSAVAPPTPAGFGAAVPLQILPVSAAALVPATSDTRQAGEGAPCTRGPAAAPVPGHPATLLAGVTVDLLGVPSVACAVPDSPWNVVEFSCVNANGAVVRRHHVKGQMQVC